MLQKGDPGPEHEYVCLLSAIASPDMKLGQVIITPKKLKTRSGHTTYDLIARGFLWQFLVSGHTHEIPWDEIPLSESGVFKVYKKGVVPEKRYMPGIIALRDRQKSR